MVLGIRAAILAVGNCAPKQCAEIQRLYDEGKHFAAKELQSRLLPVNKAVTDTYSVAGLKYACTLMGYEGEHVRSPLLPLADEEKTAIRQILKEAELLSCYEKRIGA